MSSLLVKSFGVSLITGTITEIVKVILVNISDDLKSNLIISLIFAYTIAYIGQRFVFGGGRFFGISLLKYIAIAVVSIQLSKLVLDKYQKLKFVNKLFSDPEITSFKKKLFNYLIMNAAILTIFVLFDYPMRKYFIFEKRHTDYIAAYLLFGIASVIYLLVLTYDEERNDKNHKEIIKK